MTRNDAIKGQTAEATLEKVLDVLLALAFDEQETCWQQIEAEKGPQECQKLRKSLIVSWEGDRDQPDKPAWIEVSSGFHRKTEKKTSIHPTTTAIRECAKWLNHWKITTSDISNALKRLETYGPFENKLIVTQGEGCRHFKLVFTECRDRSKRGCKQFVLDEMKKKFEAESAEASGHGSKKPPTDELSSLDEKARSCLDGVRDIFERLPEVRERRIHVPLKVKLALPGQTERVCVPEAADLRNVVASSRSEMLLISEEGGAGKTSLAFEIARWALAGQLATHPLLPILYDPADLAPGTSVAQAVHPFLRSCGGQDLDLDDVEMLLRKKRLLLILDHFSELTDKQRQWAPKHLPTGALVVLTSRLERDGDDFVRQYWNVTRIQPQRLRTSQELFSFFEHYLQAKEKAEPGSTTAFTANNQSDTKDLLQRMVGSKEITVLLAWMVIEKALNHVRNGELLGLLPSSVPQLMRNYVNDIDKTVHADSRRLDDEMMIDGPWVLASLKALALGAHEQGEGWFPKDFHHLLAVEILKKVPPGREQGGSSVQSEGLLRYLEEKLHLIKRTGTDEEDPCYRLSLDPLADYLAAMAQLERLQGDHSAEEYFKAVDSWCKGLLGRRDYGKNPEGGAANPLERSRGFLAACRDCFEEWLNRDGPSKESGLREQWEKEVLDNLALLAGIDRQKERMLQAEFLIRRHAHDLAWANPELRPKAIADLTAYAMDAEGPADMAVAVKPLALTMAEASIPHADRAAAAEALGHIGGTEAADSLQKMVENAEEPVVAVRRAAAEALGLSDASPKDHWEFLKALLEEEANHLNGETDPERIQAKLPLLQGASRGLQRLAARSRPFALPRWGAGAGLEVPMLTLTTAAGAVTTRVVTIPVWQLPLPGGIPLEVVAIPGGTYIIGSPQGEDGRQAYGHRPEAEGVEVEPRRQVTVPPFAMARYPLSQAQWKALAGERLEDPALALDPEVLDPSKEKGTDLPVESVNWRDAQRWCARLHRHLEAELGEAAPRVGLPSESLWEVACRAGADTPTPFHFGDTLDPSWANYDATYVYESGRKGAFLNRTTPVGAYGLVNAWGLADLHGQVWEWCADVWHPSPMGGPTDGRPWLEPLQGLLETKLLRGGSWFDGPHYCRSAYRGSSHPDNRSSNVGFRVCCLPPGLPSWSLVP